MGSDGSSSPEPAKATGTVERGQERFGPLVVRRYEKGDGRALILFDRAGETQAEDPPSEAPDREG
jgi:hypothetical protein